MNIYYDFEFLESGHTSPLVPISLGMTRDDGAEFYAVFKDEAVISLALENPWLRGNVIPFLPVTVTEKHYTYPTWLWGWNLEHPDYASVLSRRDIMLRVREFVLEHPDPQLWGWYSDYDHVLLAQLFGRMTDLPAGFPMYTNDLRQESRHHDLPAMPDAKEHSALSDAREIRWRYHYMQDSWWDCCPCDPDGDKNGCTVI